MAASGTWLRTPLRMPRVQAIISPMDISSMKARMASVRKQKAKYGTMMLINLPLINCKSGLSFLVKAVKPEEKNRMPSTEYSPRMPKRPMPS